MSSILRMDVLKFYQMVSIYLLSSHGVHDKAIIKP